MATGIAYLEETVRMQEEEYKKEENARRRALRGIGLAKSLLEVARQHHQQQDPTTAVELYVRAKAMLEEAIEERQTDDSEKGRKAVVFAQFSLTEVMSSLGVAYNDLGRVEEALEQLQKTLEMRKYMVGKRHPSVAECLNNLGSIYYSRGFLQKAVEHFEEALEQLAEASEGRLEGAYVALTLYNIGLCRSGLGEVQAALVALERALKIAEAALGREHRQVQLIRETLQQGPQRRPVPRLQEAAKDSTESKEPTSPS